MDLLFKKWVSLVVMVLITVQAAACYGPFFRSRGMVVKLPPAGPSALEVKDFVYAALGPRGFVDRGVDGRDAITQNRAAYHLSGPSGMQVVIQVDRPSEVPIRVNQDRKTFSQEANQVFNDLLAAIEARWPGSVAAEPQPTK